MPLKEIKGSKESGLTLESLKVCWNCKFRGVIPFRLPCSNCRRNPTIVKIIEDKWEMRD